MSTLFLILLSFACIHFIYEQILLPSIRQKLRSDFFELRDTLRDKQNQLSVEGRLTKDIKKVFSGVDERIKFAADNVHFFNIYNFTKMLVQSKELEESGNRSDFIQALINSEEESAKEIYTKTLKTIEKSVCSNSLLLLIYITPIFLLVVLASKLIKAVTNKCYQVSDDLLKAIMSNGQNTRSKSLINT